MDSVETKIIGNEFEHSPNLIRYWVQNHRIQNNYQQKSNLHLNTAEETAMKIEQIRLEEEILKRRNLEEGKRKVMENIKNYKKIIKLEEEKNQKLILEQKNKKEKAKEYNVQLRIKATKKRDVENSTDNQELKNEISLIRDNELDTFSFNEIDQEEKLPVPMSRESIHQKMNPLLNSNVINIRDDIDKQVREKLEKITIKSSIKNNNENISEELDKNIQNIKDFRKTGSILKNEVNNSLLNNNMPSSNEISNKNSKNELEKRR